MDIFFKRKLIIFSFSIKYSKHFILSHIEFKGFIDLIQFGPISKYFYMEYIVVRLKIQNRLNTSQRVTSVYLLHNRLENLIKNGC